MSAEALRSSSSAEALDSLGSDLDAATLYGLLTLRVEVFVVEQDCPYRELDGADLLPGTRHFWLTADGGRIVSTLRLLAPDPQDGSPYRIGRVCTAAEERGRGHTARLMAAALAVVADAPCVLNAQTYLTGMYARYGFAVDGPEFVEDGIAHVPMRRTARL